LRRCLLSDLQGGDAEENAAIVREVLGGNEGPKRDIVLLNSAYALVASGIVESVESGLQKARNTIDAGLAKAKLEGLVSLTNA